MNGGIVERPSVRWVDGRKRIVVGFPSLRPAADRRAAFDRPPEPAEFPIRISDFHSRFGPRFTRAAIAASPGVFLSRNVALPSGASARIPLFSGRNRMISRLDIV